MSTLLSVNVGKTTEVAWQGRTVRTSIWKSPVSGRVMARRLNIDGDAQTDLQGHGGEQRAVMVYQMSSYRFWNEFLGRDQYEYGQFGENLAVEGSRMRRSASATAIASAPPSSRCRSRA